MLLYFVRDLAEGKSFVLLKKVDFWRDLIFLGELTIRDLWDLRVCCEKGWVIIILEVWVGVVNWFCCVEVGVVWVGWVRWVRCLLFGYWRQWVLRVICIVVWVTWVCCVKYWVVWARRGDWWSWCFGCDFWRGWVVWVCGMIWGDQGRW